MPDLGQLLGATTRTVTSAADTYSVILRRTYAADIEAAGSTTILTLTHSQVTEKTAVDYGYGWEDFLNRLTSLLSGDDPAAVSWSDAQQHLKPLWEDLFEKA